MKFLIDEDKTMKERQIQTEFSKVCKIEGVFELKLEKGNSMPYSKVEDHQIEALFNVKHKKGLFHKITDSLPKFGGNAHMRFTRKKPFDCFFIREYPAYVAICFYVPREKRKLILIDIDKFMNAKTLDTRKSLTKEKAMEISELIVDLKI